MSVLNVRFKDRHGDWYVVTETIDDAPDAKIIDYIYLFWGPAYGDSRLKATVNGKLILEVA